MYLGIEEQSGYVYEGMSGADVLAVPTPSVTQAKLIESEDDWNRLPSGLSHSPFSWLFREDSFDPVTRTRRGRLYESREGQSQPDTVHVRPHLYDDPSDYSIKTKRRIKHLFLYAACHSLLNKPHQGLGHTLALGSTRAASAWRVVQVEVVVSGCIMVTLKSLATFDILPGIDLSKIESENKLPVSQAIDRVLSAAFRETPISVIDHCRNAMAVVIARWLAQNGSDHSVLSKDLSAVSSAVSQSPHNKQCVGNLGKTLAILHVRGKANEQHVQNLRTPVEEDAEMAMQSLGFAIRDLGWATIS